MTPPPARRTRKARKLPGSEWRVCSSGPRGHREYHFEAENKGIFDEVVVGDWLHVERMDANRWWFRIGQESGFINATTQEISRQTTPRRRAAGEGEEAMSADRFVNKHGVDEAHALGMAKELAALDVIRLWPAEELVKRDVEFMERTLREFYRRTRPSGRPTP